MNSSFYYLDDIDKKILNILQQDSRIPFSRLAKMLNLSEATIYVRIKRLKENGVIKGFYTEIDFDKIGLSVVAFILIKADPKKYDNILKQLVEMKEIYEIYDVTGEYYAVLKVRVPTREDLAKVLDKIGNMDGVTSTYTMLVLRSIKDKKELDL
ncbi:Lrp/AsnC family transcriptional regulator [Saccharolobus solfataricus]|uniref:Transcriptional regulatory protein, AsnC family (AsnC) n=3 Tax=Saccharolobus solfataricus TaxID=2287 RepID=Q97W90_SACS2|nr:Lrp/AsnC family transcriptional regulator [Saccharolobus solfataricus]AAK42498.1 Transcriptional regulatory protein, AsnC family (asnC) [Saccharolobus solfataricus P2]AKA72596.1 Lrp/AsnC family transcriptional regulator [Saccharolobus solfataricus]AKA75295.1 Lrp/AsnC family transcriptional regulator [Saccharolobus solfataricus]AKA77988.1 Lrp/AsnC family transcriptional regulator [Saccharolobus solfataricus]AZF67107.1 Lrp/AsnC family transcriptional regulator [Saccharolobus solfataricus]